MIKCISKTREIERKFKQNGQWYFTRNENTLLCYVELPNILTKLFLHTFPSALKEQPKDMDQRIGYTWFILYYIDIHEETITEENRIHTIIKAGVDTIQAWISINFGDEYQIKSKLTSLSYILNKEELFSKIPRTNHNVITCSSPKDLRLALR